MQNKGEALLSVRNLCQYFKMGKSELKAVDDVSFDIMKGEVFGLVGESGCGKTTTGRSIIKLYNITSGDIYFKGVRISAGLRSHKDAIKNKKKEYREKLAKAGSNEAEELKQELKRFVAEEEEAIRLAKHDQKKCDKKLLTQIQMIFQDPIASLDPRLTVREIIAEGLIIQGEKNKEVINQKVYEMLELVGLVREHATRYPHEFSGGQRQRIGVARSIIMNPDLIIADEPVSALDVSIQAQVINLLNELREKFGLTLMFVAHDLSVVKYFSDRIGVMYYGKMVELAPSDDLFRNPLHPYTKSLLSAIPLPDPIYEKQRVRTMYNPLAEHDYSVDKPTFREITPGHFVNCNQEEFNRYCNEIK